MLAVVEMVEVVAEEVVMRAMSCRGKAVFRGVVRLSSRQLFSIWNINNKNAAQS